LVTYTAAAIASFAYQERALVLDVNIRRLFGRLYDGSDQLSAAPTKNEN
jgi:A/G-specific adenine glycosylase